MADIPRLPSTYEEAANLLYKKVAPYLHASTFTVYGSDYTIPKLLTKCDVCGGQDQVIIDYNEQVMVSRLDSVIRGHRSCGTMYRNGDPRTEATVFEEKAEKQARESVRKKYIARETKYVTGWWDDPPVSKKVIDEVLEAKRKVDNARILQQENDLLRSALRAPKPEKKEPEVRKTGKRAIALGEDV